MHHIIDPATGTPVARTWRTISVAAAGCTEANIAATAAFVRAAGAPEWLARLGLPARLTDWEGNVTVLAAWPAEGPARPRSKRSVSSAQSGASLSRRLGETLAR